MILTVRLMNKTKLLIASALLASTTCGFAQNRIDRMTVSQPVRIYMPVMNDSINTAGEKYTAKDLLGNYVTTDLEKLNGSEVKADTAGIISLTRISGENNIYMLGTTARSDRFLKAILNITSPARYEVIVNGQSKLTKDTAEDSLQCAPLKTVALRMEPETNYDIRIKLLSASDDKAEPQIKCELKKDEGFDNASLVTAPDMKKRFLLENTTYTNKVIRVSLSPDGKYLATLIQNKYSKDNSNLQSKLTETATGKVIAEGLNTKAAWMPKSNKLYYTVKGENGFDVRTIDPKTLKEETILTNVPEENFGWSPNEDYLMFYLTDKGVNEAGPLKRILTPDDRIPGDRNRTFLAKYDIKTGVTQRLTYGNRSTYINSISPDGSKILYSTSTPNTTGRPLTLTSIYEVDVNTLAVDTILYNEPFVNDANYSPDGTQLLLTGSPSAFNGIGLNCGDHKIANDFDIQAFIMNRSDKSITPITKDFNPTVYFLQWNKKDGCIYFNTDDENCKHIYKYDPMKKQFEMLPLEKDVIQMFDIAENNPSIAAYTGMDDSSAGAAYLFDMKKKKSVMTDNPMQETIEDIEWGETREWNFTASDGTTIKGQICLPPSFDANKKYPLIVYYYGGTTPTPKGITSPYCAQIFASRDYVVYIVQPSGATGFGQEFSARHVNAWGKRTADDIIEGTKQFCKEHPFVDTSKIGCIGASYGGFMTQYLQTRTDIFAAAVSHAGISNVTSYWGEGYWGYSYNSIAAADSFPWSDPELFTKQGSLFNADKINTPLLLLHGTADTNVPIGESIQLFNALKILGKPVEFIAVEGEDHFVMDFDKRQQWQNTIMAWFAKWLQDSPQWWDDLYPEKHY